MAPTRGAGGGVRLPPMNALEILRETVRVLRGDPHAFTSILFLLLCPASGCLLLSAAALDGPSCCRWPGGSSSRPRRRGSRSRISSGRWRHHLAATLVSSLVSFPALLTLLLAARAAVAYSVAAVYAGKPLAAGTSPPSRAARGRASLPRTCSGAPPSPPASSLSLDSSSPSAPRSRPCSTRPTLSSCAGLFTVLAYSVMYAHTIIICNLGGVIAVLEEVAGFNALRRSVQLMRGQTHVGLLIFLGSTIGLAFVEGLFEHRVKTLSYGDGSSRLWEGPLLVLMYSS
ncbi:hypothetical protein HU200_054880 [Digitaria exilis]|uniref:Uncharacterized protein n=1 Tax=Digitaria exilis TaxID=1010633 RepID=A0A835E3S2_9POAL|nr:hypothetical protein HU200_054880 [Digitaria exilis]